MQRFKRFARYHEIFVNSGRFRRGLDLLVANAPTGSPGAALLALSDRLWELTGQDHALAQPRQYDLLLDVLLELGTPEALAIQSLIEDVTEHGNLRHAPARLRQGIEAKRPHPGARTRKRAGSRSDPPLPPSAGGGS